MPIQLSGNRRGRGRGEADRKHRGAWRSQGVLGGQGGHRAKTHQGPRSGAQEVGARQLQNYAKI